MSQIAGILFDKDGTLFDFHKTWSVWAGNVIEELADGDDTVAQDIAAAAGYDLEARKFLPESAIIAGTNREAAELFASALPDRDVDDIETHLMLTSAEAPLAEAVPLGGFLKDLADRGLRLGVMTNDTEYGARAHLDAAGVAQSFDFIAGFDSGFGAKPDPAPLLAFAEAQQLAPDTVVMVGDSVHDLEAGRRAGMKTVAVLTGVAEARELSDLADVVLPNIGHIPEWLDSLTAA